MSHRPIEQKQRRRVAKAIRRGRLARHTDLIRWLKDRRHARTTKEAMALITDERVMAGSHPLGLTIVPMLNPEGVEAPTKIVQAVVPTPADPIYVKAA